MHPQVELMNCLLISATATEIAPFLSEYQSGNHLTEDLTVDILIAGIGVMATTYSLSRQLKLKRPDLIIQAGIAGCFDSTLSLGAVFAVKKDTIADLGVMEDNQFKTIFDLKLAVAGMHPYSNSWLINNTEPFKKVKLKKVSGITVNEITTNKKKIQIYAEKYSPVIESMEGAAVHYVSIMEKIPFIQLRAVSNYIGERRKDRWNTKEAILNLNKELNYLLNKI